MLNHSCISCLTINEYKDYRQSVFTERHESTFGPFKEKNVAFYNFSKTIITQLPFNMINFLADNDLRDLCSHLFNKLNDRGSEKFTISLDMMDDLSFFIGNFSVFTLVTDDRPFIYDSIWQYFQEEELSKLFIIHPIMSVERDGKGAVTKVANPTLGSDNESFVVIFMETVGEDKTKKVYEELIEIYQNLVSAVDDFPGMQNLMTQMSGEYRETVPEMSQFIHWLQEDNFIFQGARVVDINTETKEYSHKDLGIFSVFSGEPKYKFIGDVIMEERINLVDGYPVVVDKSLKRSKVKERANMDRIIMYEKRENYIRVVFVLGLFSNKARRVPPHEISILKNRIKLTLDHFNFVNGSHDYKWVRDIIDGFPKIEMFNSSVESMVQTLELILSMQGASQVRICYRDFRPLKNLFFLIALPSNQFSHGLMLKIEKVLEKHFKGIVLDVSTRVDAHKRYYLHYHIYVEDTTIYDSLKEEDLKDDIVSLMRNWESFVYEILRERLGGNKVDIAYEKYVSTFSESYKAKNDADDALEDIIQLEKLKDFSSVLDCDEEKAVLKIYSFRRILLTELMPIMDNVGLKVYEEDIHELKTKDGDYFINHIYIAADKSFEGSCPMYMKILPELVSMVLREKVENDRLNSLVVIQNLTYRQVDLLRAVRNFIRQIEGSFTVKTLNDALINNPQIAHLLHQYFDEKFNPSKKDSDLEELSEEIRRLIDGVMSASEDKALRYYMHAMAGMLRTNYYMNKDYISFKFASKEMEIIKPPKPMFEIFVHSSTMNGLHLRGGKVARGGLRYSDRMDDFRTEVLGLVKTQIVKNSLIVPVGSKGGFIIKKHFEDRDEEKANVLRQYQTLIRGLLDITDNYKGTKIVHPDNCRYYDGDDPYLVVAADKGTATYSDEANKISAEYGFWLDDAFASGGQFGYDHKKVGITAKGAWESVKRHFRELGKDIQKEDFTVIGIGDMSGDVFGNGMLLSKHIRLQAAFNHMHIFVDPDPDAAVSYKERERLFVTPGTKWSDYKPELISKGGGVFDRNAKKISLSKEMQKMLGVVQDSMSGEELIKNILQMDVELLWNGGIGTYVRASSQTNIDVGDAANDGVRISAAELKAKVVGEGGNLGFTQKARIEFDSLGGQIYTDALDNSGGVDTSDHEVNLKIMLGQLMKKKLIKDNEERNNLIERLTDDVRDLVLRNNYTQSKAVSQSKICFERKAVTFREVARFLRDIGLLNFEIENIEYVDQKKPATAPELAVILSYMKIHLNHELEETLDLENKYVRDVYMKYYPESFRQEFKDELPKHTLMKQMTVTFVVNKVIDQAGAGYFYETIKSTGAPYAEVIENYLLAEDILGCDPLREQIYALDNKATAQSQYVALMAIEKTLKVAIEWIIQEPKRKVLLENLDRFQSVLDALPKNLNDETKAMKDAYAEKLIEDGFPKKLAGEVSNMRFFKAAFDNFEILYKTEASIKDVLKRYYDIGFALDINLFTSRMKTIEIRNEWERENKESLLIRVKRLQKKLAMTYCTMDKNWLSNLREKEVKFFESYDRFIENLKNDEIDSLVPFNVITDMLATLVTKYEV